MLPVVFRRCTFAAQKALLWAGPSQKCWTSALTRASNGGSASPCWASTTKLLSTQRDTGQVKRLAVLGVSRTELFQPTQTHEASFLVRNQHFHSSAVKLKKRVKPESPPREVQLLRDDMTHLWQGPKPALYLGFAGLIPFVCPTLFMAMTETYYPELAFAQVAYAASIVSFVGGARWGFALPESSPAKPDWLNLANSVVPSLFAWLTMMMMSSSIVTGGTMVIITFGIALHYDLALLPTYPSWFKALRAVLTMVACSFLTGTLMMDGSFPEKTFFSD